MKKSVFSIVACIISWQAGYSHEITRDQAWSAARNFMNGRITQSGLPLSTGFTMNGTFFVSDNNVPLYYIFNLDPSGWISIAATDAVFPVLAYSFEGSYDPGNQAPQFTAWIKQYEDQIRYAIREGIPPFPLTEEMWSRLTDARFPVPDARQSETPLPSHSPALLSPTSYVSPLITSHWNQSPWYNEMCPSDPAGPGGHCVAGCVPVCMAQVMYYFRWPVTGTGSYTYTEPNYGILTANFGATTYAWNEMTDAINRSNLAIAELIYHLGVSCDLQYGPGSSGMYNHKAAYSFRTFFKYSPLTQYLFRDSTNLNWDSVLTAHLDRKIPMYYAGWSVPNVNGHAFVCDGYQDSCFFHFNFGWGGNSDGYFYTNDLTPGGSNFNLAQEVVINCFPDTVTYSWPVQCAGGLVLLNKVGSLEDGSGPVDDYLPTANCLWLIDPQTGIDSVTGITLTSGRFATNPEDFVTIYDGHTTGSPVLGIFSGDTLPPAITSTGNQMLISFTASGLAPENGFYATYSSTQPVWCSGTTNIKTDTAEFSDGSFGFNYYNNTICKWKVESESGDTLTIYFSAFDTEEGKDFLTVYDFETGDTLACISGQYFPGALPDSVTSPSGKMFIIFTTNSSVTANGWEIYYPRKPDMGIAEPAGLRNLHVYPNPAQDQINLEFTAWGNMLVSVILSTPDGRVVLRQESGTIPGKNLFPIDVSGWSPGVYFLLVHNKDGAIARKLIIR